MTSLTPLILSDNNCYRGKRPVEIELIEVFKQKDYHITVAEAIEVLISKGHRHTPQAVRDNLELLAIAGFLIQDGEGKFSISPNSANADLTKRTLIKLPTRAYKIYEHKQLPPSDHCDKCGKEFEPGVEWRIKQFANNIQLVLCAECHTPPKQDFAHIAPCFCSE